jgi:hypothetical protein
MAAEQRDHGGAVLGEHDDRRFLVLVGEQRRDGAHDDARGHDRDDRLAAREQRAELGARVVEGGVARGDAAREPVDQRSRESGLQPAGECRTRLGQRHEARGTQRHAMPLRCTRISEKYGTEAGSTSSSARMRWSSKLARSM